VSLNCFAVWASTPPSTGLRSFESLQSHRQNGDIPYFVYRPKHAFPLRTFVSSKTKLIQNAQFFCRPFADDVKVYRLARSFMTKRLRDVGPSGTSQSCDSGPPLQLLAAC
jgi:hypothetical protein